MKQIKKIVHSVFLGLIALGLSSCSEKQLTQDVIVKNNAEEYIKERMNDPSSYEFVRIELIDSVLYKDNIEYRRNYFSRNIDFRRRSLERQKRYKTQMLSLYDEKEVESIKAIIERNERILLGIDSLEAELGDKKYDVASYTYIFRFRGNNALGVKILNEYIIQTNQAPDFRIINMTDDINRIYLNPNDFPGYRELIEKIGDETIYIGLNEKTRRTVSLQTHTGSLQFTVSPTNAKVRLVDDSERTVEIWDGSRLLSGLTSGSYTLHIEASGYERGEQGVIITKDQTLPVHVDLKPLVVEEKPRPETRSAEVSIDSQNITDQILSRTVSGDTLYLIVYARYGNLEPIRVNSDVSPSDRASGTALRPYWVEQRHAMRFEFIDQIVLQGTLSRMLLIYNGHVIDDFSPYYMDGRQIRITRDDLIGNPDFSEPNPSPFSGIPEPRTLKDRPRFAL